MRPNLREEKKLWRAGYKRIAGLDEAGRGSLAGPVVASAVIITTAEFKSQNAKCKTKIQNLKLLKEINDSKKLTARKREELYKLIKNSAIEWAIGKVSEKIIDKVNVLEATKLAMKKALKYLEKKLRKNLPEQKTKKARGYRFSQQLDFLILDGNFKLNLDIPQKSIIKADEKVFSCACASILAKVTRDRLMEKHHKRYPQYSFARHKGYPTKLHCKLLKKHGPSKIHRKSFHPLKEQQLLL